MSAPDKLQSSNRRSLSSHGCKSTNPAGVGVPQGHHDEMWTIALKPRRTTQKARIKKKAFITTADSEWDQITSEEKHTHSVQTCISEGRTQQPASTDCMWRGEDITSGQDNHTPAHTEPKQNADTQQRQQTALQSYSQQGSESYVQRHIPLQFGRFWKLHNCLYVFERKKE